MKTPKRKQETCSRCGGELKVLDTKGSFCHRCGIFVNLGDGLRERHARWKRRNREAMLRHALRRKENANRLLAEKLVRARLLELAYERFIDKMLESYFEIGTYGQDIEGS